MNKKQSKEIDGENWNSPIILNCTSSKVSRMDVTKIRYQWNLNCL